MSVEEAIAILEQSVHPGYFNKLQIEVFRKSWEQQSYEEIASELNYRTEYIKQIGSKLWKQLGQSLGTRITKGNFRSVLQQYYATPTKSLGIEIPIANQVSPEVESQTKNFQDWGDAIDASVFFGRQEELSCLQQWIVEDQCRLIVLVGMGGIGKTALAVRAAQQMQGEFDYLIWRSLRNAPPIEQLLGELIQFFGGQQGIDVPETLDGKILCLMNYLRSHRCLVILDNAESILHNRNAGEHYQEEYSGYDQLMRCLAESFHQSCVLITSREKPVALAANEGEGLLIRCLQLAGLTSQEGREIFQLKGQYTGSEFEWETLVQHYGGNPLVLKIVSTKIIDLFNGNLSTFIQVLKQRGLIFDEISHLLAQHFQRLSEPEKKLMQHFAINRQPISMEQLHNQVIGFDSYSQLLVTLTSLLRCSLIDKHTYAQPEKGVTYFRQKPFVMEYMNDILSIKKCEETFINNSGFLHQDIRCNTIKFKIN